MKTKAILFVIFTIMLFALGVLITTIFNTAPTTKDAVLMFYSSSFLVIFGLIFFSLYVIKWLRTQSAPVGNNVGTMVRTSLIFDSFLLIILALRAGDLLNWATTLVLLVAAIILTLVFRKRIA